MGMPPERSGNIVAGSVETLFSATAISMDTVHRTKAPSAPSVAMDAPRLAIRKPGFGRQTTNPSYQCNNFRSCRSSTPTVAPWGTGSSMCRLLVAFVVVAACWGVRERAQVATAVEDQRRALVRGHPPDATEEDDVVAAVVAGLERAVDVGEASLDVGGPGDAELVAEGR